MSVCEKCGKKIKLLQKWVLKDTVDFGSRSLIIGKCESCGVKFANLKEKRIEDKKSFSSITYGKRAEGTILKESKRTLQRLTLEGNSVKWSYGTNIQIKNKLGKVVQLRQYATDYACGKKSLLKKIFC